ncbi:hypothetical protein HPP92_002520 [Vanilla planifolia]|uniref:Uncharacterized protein n=1 Tax=Vanilla planifolia TaxID=51239 RepID=A0A835VMK5_VANPL|nr:hypothetical protein HPP92_002520 [Vanilla planifolia]
MQIHKLYSPSCPVIKACPLVSSLPDSKQPSIKAPPIHAVASHQSVPSSVPLPTQQQLRQAPPNMQRMGLQQNHHLKPDGQLQSSSELVQVKQMVPVASGSQTAESINPPLTLPLELIGNRIHPWRNTSSHENLSGNNAVKVSSRQLSGSMSILGHVAGGQWQQQQNSKTQSSLPSLQQNQQRCTRKHTYVLQMQNQDDLGCAGLSFLHKIAPFTLFNTYLQEHHSEQFFTTLITLIVESKGTTYAVVNLEKHQEPR